jgi:hypothetical protein
MKTSTMSSAVWVNVLVTVYVVATVRNSLSHASLHRLDKLESGYVSVSKGYS